VDDARAANYRLTTSGVGHHARLEVVRKGRRLALDVALSAPPKAGRDDVRNLSGAHPFDGARVANILPGAFDEMGVDDQDGVVILSVRPGSTAARLGFQPRDIIVQVGREKIASVNELENLLKQRQRVWQLVVKRGNQVIQLQVAG
jgi:S1-C subfamily serine protease